MGMANLNLEDMPDGTIAVQAVYVGGFDSSYHSHQHLLLVQKILDTLLTQQTPAEVEMVVRDPTLMQLAEAAREKIAREGLENPTTGLLLQHDPEQPSGSA